MTSKTVSAKGGSGTYSVTAGQAAWAWASGSNSDGVKYATTDVPTIASNKDDLEIVNGTTWNENIVCVRDVTTSSDNYRVLLVAAALRRHRPASRLELRLQHLRNAHHLQRVRVPALRRDSSTSTRPPERSTTTRARARTCRTADVEAPVVDELIDIAGTSTTNRVKNLTFQGLTFANTD